VTNLGTTGTLNHNLAISPDNQEWVAIHDDGLGTVVQLENGYISDMTDDTMDYDFTGLAGSDIVTLKLKSTAALGAGNNLARTFTMGKLSSDPSGTIPHGLGAVPSSMIVQHEGHNAAGLWTNLNPKDYCDVDETNLYCDFAPLTVDGTHRLRVAASTAVNPSLVDQAAVQANTQAIADLTADIEELLTLSIEPKVSPEYMTATTATGTPAAGKFHSEISGRAPLFDLSTAS
jgi:hypothetical protein